MKKKFNCIVLASCFVLGATLAHADSKTQADINASHENQQIDGSGSLRNKMDDSGKDPKGKERSTNMSGDWDKQRDDAWHKKSDGTWDKKRDDEWHKKNESSQGGTSHPSQH